MFVLLYVYFLTFVYWVCLEVHKPFYIFPYAFYVLLFVLLLYFYLRVCQSVLRVISLAAGLVRDFIKEKVTLKKQTNSDNQIIVKSDENHISENLEQIDGTISENSVDNTL